MEPVSAITEAAKNLSLDRSWTLAEKLPLLFYSMNVAIKTTPNDIFLYPQIIRTLLSPHQRSFFLQYMIMLCRDPQLDSVQGVRDFGVLSPNGITLLPARLRVKCGREHRKIVTTEVVHGFKENIFQTQLEITEAVTPWPRLAQGRLRPSPSMEEGQ